MDFKRFKKVYITPNRSKRVDLDEFYIMVSQPINYEQVRQHLLTVSFNCFYQTRYWRILSVYIKSMSNRCEICGDFDKLNVHHKTYRHYGIEHMFPQDLQVLCDKCHRSEHKKRNAPRWADRGK
jgi:5-methylcytosine-specific restriction endonuclease McrA